ncbi:MAG: hypothetical protein ACK5PB_19265 [Pirellula sp.]|jgi:hypothetical protein
MSDSLTPKEIDGLEQIAEWLDMLYIRLQGAEIIFAMQVGNERYCESLQADIATAVETGIAMNRPMESCGCLFEALNGDCEPQQFLMRARQEINALAIAVRQIALYEHFASKTSSNTVARSKYPGLTELYRERKANPKLADSEKTYGKAAEAYKKTLDRNDKTTIAQLRKWLTRPENH